MKIRADIVALIVEGHTDAHIAHRVGCSRMTVYRARQAMERKTCDPEQRLYAEELPTGRVRDYDRRRQPITASQAAANRRALEEALRVKPKPSRHLHAVPERTAA